MGIGAAIIGSAAIGAGGSIIGGMAQSDAAKTAAKQSGANMQAVINQENMNYQRNLALNQPYLGVGQDLIPQLNNQQFYDPAQQQALIQQNLDPSMAFRMQQGNAAVEGSAAAHGSLFSGGTGRALQDYAQGLASTEYNNAYNRTQNSLTNSYNRLTGTIGIGQNAVANQMGINSNQNQGLVNAMNANSQNQMSSTIGQGNATAGAAVGVGNSVAGALGNYGMYNAGLAAGTTAGTTGGNVMSQAVQGGFNNGAVTNYARPQAGSWLNVSGYGNQ